MKKFEQMNEDERKVFLQGIAQEVANLIDTRLDEVELNNRPTDFKYQMNYNTYHTIKDELTESNLI